MKSIVLALALACSVGCAKSEDKADTAQQPTEDPGTAVPAVTNTPTGGDGQGEGETKVREGGTKRVTPPGQPASSLTDPNLPPPLPGPSEPPTGLARLDGGTATDAGR
jgi:hypothetical protein